MSDDWPLAIDGFDFNPIPENWIEPGEDTGHPSCRFYAVSAAVFSRDDLRVRYLNPTICAVCTAVFMGQSNADGDGIIPAMLANYHTWPRSLAPNKDCPLEPSHPPEEAHFRRLWDGRLSGSRCQSQQPSDDDQSPIVSD